MSGSSDGQLEQNAQKVVEFHELLDRMTFWVPRGNDIATIKGIQTLHGEEKTKFVLMRWIQGGIDAYITNAGNTSVFPFLPLREIKGTALSWDFLMGTLPKPGLGGSVSIGDIPPELCRCGRFRIDITTGNWKFNLNSRQVISQESTNNGRWPVRIGIPVTLKNENAEPIEVSQLSFTIHSDEMFGAIVCCEYNGTILHGLGEGVFRALQPLACGERAGYGDRIMGWGEYCSYMNNSILLCSEIFLSAPPQSLTDAIENGDPEGHKDQVRRVIGSRLDSLTFSKSDVDRLVIEYDELSHMENHSRQEHDFIDEKSTAIPSSQENVVLESKTYTTKLLRVVDILRIKISVNPDPIFWVASSVKDEVIAIAKAQNLKLSSLEVEAVHYAFRLITPTHETNPLAEPDATQNKDASTRYTTKLLPLLDLLRAKIGADPHQERWTRESLKAEIDPEVITRNLAMSGREHRALGYIILPDSVRGR